MHPSHSESYEISHHPFEDLTLDSSGEAVIELQLGLRAAGLYAGAIDGIFGAETRAAVEAFQRVVQVRPTGSADARLTRSIALMARHHRALAKAGALPGLTAVPFAR